MYLVKTEPLTYEVLDDVRVETNEEFISNYDKKSCGEIYEKNFEDPITGKNISDLFYIKRCDISTAAIKCRVTMYLSGLNENLFNDINELLDCELMLNEIMKKHNIVLNEYTVEIYSFMDYSNIFKAETESLDQHISKITGALIEEVLFKKLQEKRNQEQEK